MMASSIAQPKPERQPTLFSYHAGVQHALLLYPHRHEYYLTTACIARQAPVPCTTASLLNTAVPIQRRVLLWTQR